MNFSKGLASERGGPDHGATFLCHKLNPVAGFQAEPFTNLLRNGDLSFAANCAGGSLHLYRHPLQ